MKESITLTLSYEELMELHRIMPHDYSEGALHFLKAHLDKKVKSAISGEGH